MAEHVQEALDRMVAPLRDLMEREIFSEQEVKAIVERRRESEYLLRRITARKADFLRYIQAEQDLERLRQLRMKQRHRDHLKSKTTIENKEEQRIGDAHIVQHLHLLFVRAIRKFRSDLSLHLLHADFCKQMKSYSRLGRVYTEALQIFPRQSGLWIEAASNEFFGPNHSIGNARVLLQRGIRFNKTSEDIWLQYFSLELHFAQTLRGRRQILLGSKVTEEIAESADYKIAEIIYTNAVKAVPDSIEVRLRFLDICREFPDTEGLMKTIQEEMGKDFGDKPEVWVARALFEAEKQSKESDTKGEDEEAEQSDRSKRPSKKAKREDSVVKVLRQAIQTVPSDDMYLHAIRFSRTYEAELRQKGGELSQIEEFLSRILDTIAGHNSADLALEHADYLMECDKTIDAVKVLETFCSEKRPTKASVWIQWAGLTSPPQPQSILNKALNVIPMSHLHEHMTVLLQYFGYQLSENTSMDKLLDTFQRILLLGPGSEDFAVVDLGSCERFGLENVSDACLKFLNYALTLGVQNARKVYSLVLFQSSLKASENNLDDLKTFVERCIQLEQEDKSRRRKIFGRAIELFDGTTFENHFRHLRNNDVAV